MPAGTSILRTAPPRRRACSRQPKLCSTMSPGAKPSAADATTSPTAPPSSGCVDLERRDVGLHVVHPAAHVRVDGHDEVAHQHLAVGRVGQRGLDEAEVLRPGHPVGRDARWISRVAVLMSLLVGRCWTYFNSLATSSISARLMGVSWRTDELTAEVVGLIGEIIGRVNGEYERAAGRPPADRRCRRRRWACSRTSRCGCAGSPSCCSATLRTSRASSTGWPRVAS